VIDASRGGVDDGALPSCRLCRKWDCVPFQLIGDLQYWRCPECEAVFLDQTHLLDRREELLHYRQHQNDVADPRHRKFVSRLGDPLLACLPPKSIGLDYGCGPGPALAAILSEHGHEVATYDPFFNSEAAALERTYDFIFCSEVIEHFHRPAEEFDRLDALLKPGGWLGVMTCFRTDDDRFKDWHYRRDPTHVVFYREETLRILAHRMGWSCEIPHKDVAIMRKPGDAA